MSKMFIRVFIKDYYFEYNIKENEKVYLNSINDTLYIYMQNNKLISNFIDIKDFKLNKLYYISEYLFFYMIGSYGKKLCINNNYFKLDEIISTKAEVEVDLINRYIRFTSPIYIEKKFYEQGLFYFNDEITFCTGVYKFSVTSKFVTFNQKGKYKGKNYFVYDKSNSFRSSVDKSYKYSFSYSDSFEVFQENVSRYIIPPIIMLVVMFAVSLITKQVNMIIFMFASSISTVTASLIMYFKQRKKVEYTNFFVRQNFDLKLKKLCVQINADLISNYKNTKFELIKQNSMCIGYILESVEINQQVSDIKLNNIFNQKIKGLGSFHKKYYLNHISIIGKYAKVFLYNLLLSIINENYNQRIIFIGKFYDYKFIMNAEYYTRDDLHLIKELNDCIIILDFDIKLDYLMNNKIIYLGVENINYDILEINSLFKNKLTISSITYDFYSFIITDSKVLYLYERKICYNSSLRNSKVKKGLRLSEDYTLNIEKSGPHGLIVGMTGSGKSVLLLQIIIQIGLTYTPDEAVIGIIDFKGDALISKVKHLAHIASTFSNLNGSYENVIASIKNELVYRQKKFSEYGISEYREIGNKFYLPRLFIIIDEFAEVKKSLSNIIEEIESIARVGRSLGIFLILSLQKTSGVITEQLKSNINYKICLKVNSFQDSLEVIDSKRAALFTKPGEAIVAVNNENTYIKVFNCLGMKKPNVVINNKYISNSTILDDTIEQLNLKYNKTDYIIWKSFPIDKKDKILLNYSNKKVFVEYEFTYSNYLILGKIKSGKSELVKTIINSFDGCFVYLGKNSSFLNYVDIFISEISQIEVFISYMKTLEVETYFIIDGLELFSSELLLSFIEECAYNRYSNIKIIITALGLTGSLSRIAKVIDNKFMLAVNDPGEAYNLFYKKVGRSNFLVGEGVCSYQNSIVEFKNYLSDLTKSNKKYSISTEYDYLYLKDFSDVCVEKAVYIYDEYKLLENDFYKSFHYKEVNNIVLNEFSDRLIITSTEKFEYNFKRIKLIDQMLYDVVNDEEIIVVKNINCE